MCTEAANNHDGNENYLCLSFEHRGLKNANINICYIKPKLDGLKILLQTSKKSDILGMCETFLDDKTEDNLLHKMVLSSNVRIAVNAESKITPCAE